jgi:hypothetical protein
MAVQAINIRRYAEPGALQELPPLELLDVLASHSSFLTSQGVVLPPPGDDGTDAIPSVAQVFASPGILPPTLVEGVLRLAAGLDRRSDDVWRIGRQLRSAGAGRRRTARRQRVTRDDDYQARWAASPVTCHYGSLSQIRPLIPGFERRPFSLPQPEDRATRLHGRLDTIVRKPIGNDSDYVPVGVVSKDYALIQHLTVVDTAAAALQAAGVTDDVQADLEITEYGERMWLSLYLPDRFAFAPADGHRLAMRLECMNSVDGSSRLRVLLGWFRFICSNGMIVGVTRADVRRRHVGDIGIDGIGRVLAKRIEHADHDRRNFAAWRARAVTADQLARWADGPLWGAWGIKAAARAYHIARTGCDAEVLGPYKGEKPTTVPIRLGAQVQGMWPPAPDCYYVSQVLAWLAKERRDLQEQLGWREQIRGLMAPLLRSA